MAEVADEICADPEDFWQRSKAIRSVMADVMWEDEQQRLDEAATNTQEVEVDGERYRHLAQPSSLLLQGFWGAHRVAEPLYRLIGVRNGPTIRPLLHKIGAVEGSLLPDFADEAGELLSELTDRELETTLARLSFRPPSRTTIRNRLGGLVAGMSERTRELEEECRAVEELDFDVAAVSCGLDRFAVRMDETFPDGPERDRKLSQRRPEEEYERTPPEPYEYNYRMAWAANVTLYDTSGNSRRSFRYGAEAGHDVNVLADRVVNDVVHVCSGRQDVHVACIQDGAGDLEPLRRELRERLPEGVPRRHLVDFHHAIGYLDAVVAAHNDGDPHNMAGWYRLKLLTDDNGAEHIVRHLRRAVAVLDDEGSRLAEALGAALTYFEKRRPAMKYAEARASKLPIGSGSTESTCGLFQLRVKHPGSHWRPPGLHGTLTVRALHLSGRWETAFRAQHQTLVHEVHAM